MDDMVEHQAAAHSSVGGIYRLNRTVSTRLCHLPESVCVRVFALCGQFPAERSRRHGYAQMFGLIIQPCLEYFLSYDIWHVLLHFLYLKLLVIPPGLRCVFEETCCCSRFPHWFVLKPCWQHFYYYVVQYLSPWRDWGSWKRRKEISFPVSNTIPIQWDHDDSIPNHAWIWDQSHHTNIDQFSPPLIQ